MNSIRPLKKFGQNYLTDHNILNKIVDEISPQPDDNILEIGPGLGSLTEKLAQKGMIFSAVEIDRRVIGDLKNRFSSLNIIQKDFLELDLISLLRFEKDKLRIVGSVLMVQYEVAKRMTAKMGVKDYGILSVILSYFAEVKLKFRVSPNVFYPKPKVESAVIHLTFKEIHQSKNFQKVFISVVKASFGNRRKMLRNSLSNSIFAEIDFHH